MKYFDTKTVEYMSDIDLEVIKIIMIEEIEKRKKFKPNKETKKAISYLERMGIEVKRNGYYYMIDKGKITIC